MISLIKGLDSKHMYELRRQKKEPSFSLIRRLLISKSNSFIISFTSNYDNSNRNTHIPNSKRNVSGTAPNSLPVQCSLLADT